MSRTFPASLRVTLALLAAIAIAMPAMSIAMNEKTVVDVASAQGGNYVKVGWLSDFKNWNPLTVEMVSDWVAYNLIYSTLFQYDEDWNEIENHLAMDYYQVEWPAGNMSTYINITRNAYFRNADNPEDTSQRLTAHDVKFTFELIMANPGNAWDYYMYNVSGVYVTNPADPYQVQIDTDYTKATLIDDLVWVPILPKFQWEAFKGSTILGRMDPDDLIGSGPFIFEDYDKGTWYDFSKAPNYHATLDYDEERDIDFDGIQYLVYTDIQPLALSMNVGEVDVVDVTGASKPAWDSIDDSPDVSITKQVTAELGIYDIAINAIPLEIRDELGYASKGNELLLDPAVRKAIGMTLDRQTIIDDYFMGMPQPADTVLNPGFWHANLSNPLPYDTAEARQVLIDAGYANLDGDADGYLEATENCLPVQEGWANEGDRLQFDLHTPDSDPGYGMVGQAWVSMAKEAGIQFDFEELSEGFMTMDEWYNCNYDLWVWSWYWGPEPLSNLACWLSDQIRVGGYNCVGPICQGGLDDPDDGWWWVDQDEGKLRCGFDDDFDAALKAVDKNERKVLVDKLQEAIYDTYTEFPPLHPVGLYAFTDERFTGWGNWEAHVARTIISDMLWLWYDLEPTGTGSAPVFETPPSPLYEPEVDVPITFTISVMDADGDDIWVNWTISNATGVIVDANITEITGDTTVPTETVWTQTFDTAGEEYLLRVGLKDENHDYETVETAVVKVVAEANLGPSLEDVSWSPSRAYVGEEVTWSASAKDHEQGPEGEGLLFNWDWDDGTSTATLYQPVENDTYVKDEQAHVWDSPGSYLVEVSVWDGYDEASNPEHNVSVVVKDFEVVENVEPSIVMVTNISGIQNQEVMCEAIASDPDPDVLRFTWDWGDGTYSVTNEDTSANRGEEVTSTFNHTWDAAGTYDVTIWVDDNEEHNVSEVVTAAILPPGSEAPPGSLTIWQSPSPGAVDVPVTLMVGASDANEDALTVTIDFGDDGEMETLETLGGTTGMQYVEFSHTYTAADTYVVVVYVDDDTANVSASRNVLIVANEPPSLALATSYSFYYNQSKEIKPASIRDPDGDPLTVWYDWGDGTSMTMGNPDEGYAGSHTYDQIGNFVLEVFADDGRSNNVSATAPVNVQDANRKPVVELISKSPPAGDSYAPGETIYFNVTVSDKEGDNVTVVIDFGDDSPTEEIDRDLSPETNSTVSFSHAYEDASDTSYTVKVVVSDDQDHSDMTWLSKSTQVTIKEDKEDGINSTLLLGIGLGVLLAAAAIAMLLKRRGKPSGAAMDEMEGMAPPEETTENAEQPPSPAEDETVPPSE